ncbi:septum formation initiator family protein [Patescibacteria group bacterium]|nr:septum formation initiator family protein [Patescibacteria group bacterium]MBU1967220.1 septum formation initiator family protein [Patescibacteria group bacterium]MBU2543085.1 septum formation initiator family protein [Patescibacteria group bacterium]
MSKIIFNPVSLAVLTIISIIFSISLHKSAQKPRYLAQNLQNLESEIMKIEQDVALLEKSIEEAQQPFSQEKIIRDELLMKKPGEYVVQIPDELIKISQPQIQEENLSPWEEWQGLLF